MNTAVATANQGGAIAVHEPPMREQIALMSGKFKEALPSHVPVSRFSRFALLALTNPMVMKATETAVGRKSIYDALLKAAADGLMPDGRESALVAYDKKVDGSWFKTVQYQTMVAGILKKARNSGQIGSIVCQVRYRADVFALRFVSDGAPVTHELPDGPRGEMVGVYAVCRFKDSTWSQPEYMTKEQVDQIRARTKSRDKDKNIVGPWVTDYEEMARKTVIRRAAKTWPSSTDMESLLATIAEDVDSGDIINHAPVPSDRKKPQAAALLGSAKPEDDEEEDDASVGPDRDDGEAEDDDNV